MVRRDPVHGQAPASGDFAAERRRPRSRAPTAPPSPSAPTSSPSCWDGKNIDSTNHRDHIVFPDQNGRCKQGFKAVPQLRVTLTYNIPRDVQLAGRYKVDAFPEEAHNPKSDHDDFANVMSQRVMNRLVNCVNKNKTCKE
jgi:hypothetical protein